MSKHNRLFFQFHRRAQQLKKQLGHGDGEVAWKQTEEEFILITGQQRYKTYRSFRVVHCLYLQRLAERKG